MKYYHIIMLALLVGALFLLQAWWDGSKEGPRPPPTPSAVQSDADQAAKSLKIP